MPPSDRQGFDLPIRLCEIVLNHACWKISCIKAAEATKVNDFRATNLFMNCLLIVDSKTIKR